MRKVLLALITLTTLTVSSGCGYALAGRGSFLPAYIQIVGVPSFTNKTPVFEIERLLTDRVRTEFASRGKYRVQPDTNNVDAVLTGTIVDVRLNNSAYTTGSQAARVSLVVTASFEFRDVRENKVLWTNPSMRFTEEYSPTTATGTDVTAFLGGNSNALERLAQSFARSVVTAILEAF
jgi:outer membrane lipopolysaccharide assembly protein LptE/RlpB